MSGTSTRPSRSTLSPGYGGPGSILSKLRRNDWATDLGAGIDEDVPGFSLFTIRVQLTQDGVEHWNDIVQLIFQYMDLLRSEQLEPLFGEQQQLSDIKYQYTDKPTLLDHVRMLAKRLQRPVPREAVLSSAATYGKYNQKWIDSALSSLQLQRAIILVESPHLPPNVPGEYDRKEPFYGTLYLLHKVDTFFSTIDPELHLPERNAFIPTRFHVDETVADRPDLLVDTLLSRLWHLQDGRRPKSSINLKLQSPLLHASPRSAALGHLLVGLFDDAVAEQIYDAELTGLTYTLHREDDTLQLHLHGFPDKLGLYLETLLTNLVSFRSQRFRTVAAEVNRKVRNKLVSQA